LVSVSGAEASTAVSAAMRSVWRTFFNIVPFAVRAPKQAQRYGLGAVLAG
jgi:hypothetical protein